MAIDRALEWQVSAVADMIESGEVDAYLDSLLRIVASRRRSIRRKAA